MTSPDSVILKDENSQSELDDFRAQDDLKRNSNDQDRGDLDDGDANGDTGSMRDSGDDLDKFDEEANVNLDPKTREQQELIRNTMPTTELEVAMSDELIRKESQMKRLSGEVAKLKKFISKRKQTYKRKRKDEGAPTRALSAYNIFVQERFSRLAKENEAALNSSDADAVLKRVPPASLVASTGNQWKELPAEEKLYYEERAKDDRRRYEEQMSQYHPPNKQSNRKRNKTGYNMFFTAHVLRLKQTETGVPSERGSVARLVGNAWKELSSEERQYYEREADKQNAMHPAGDDEDDVVKKEDESGGRSDYSQTTPIHDSGMNRHPGSMHPGLGHVPVVHQPSHHGHYPPPHHAPPPHYHGYPPYDYYHQPPPPHHAPPSGSRGRGQHHSGYHYPPPPPPHYHHHYPDQG
eukprot:CAMPEP_0184856514 /NCGR_PEP_ID=MMETSP0580-20130426/1704_1 /TAXON_ID=1118495 /ORGANISM="Dactyliosolen fragilissimus" /LENGTH=407 /DNA_ID=CAMNT_0027351593 /DNA_START=382 /DNA_END=1605 /DNA_ORIENTATION=+